MRWMTVFASASVREPDGFTQAAFSLGQSLAEAGTGLIYGGGSVGLMGAVADGALSAGGEVVGVMPQSLVDAEIAHPGLTSLRVVESLHERKAELARLGDGFVALPGGAGTLEELFEAWTWQQLGLHAKPVALLNIDGFWDPLLSMLDAMVRTGFVRSDDRESLIVVGSAEALLTAVAAFDPPRPKYADTPQLPSQRS
jgi:uncharacterized protein (TIGR00730 family)